MNEGNAAIAPAKPCGCKGKTTPSANTLLTRPSCLDCVEKHLGAAWVLLAEAREGYLHHRLLAIGHLHEAQEESQTWPDLHQAIRQARKLYQQDGTIPDLAALAHWVEALRAGIMTNSS